MAEVILRNTPKNLKLSRQIRDLNQSEDASIDIHFSDDYQQVYFSGELIYLPHQVVSEGDFAVSNGELVTLRGKYCVLNRNRAKTVNVHLDSDLVAEINAIRDYISLHKSLITPEGTQHEIILEMLRRGIDKMKDDLGLE